jgi:CheY-like chemotaxis protein
VLPRESRRRLDLEHVDFHVRPVVHEVVDLLAERAQRKGLEIACLVHPDVPDCLRGDPGRLRQVLMNLVGNAVKFTEVGQIVVTVRRIPAEERVRVRFEVDDTGIGIPHEVQQRLFTCFMQADGSTTRKYGGTGLGLAISKLLVELMQGSIGVRSAEAEGSTFWFEVALEQGVETEPLPALREHLHGVRILVVDDNDTNRRILELLASGWGARVELAPDGPAGLAALRAAAGRGEPQDVVLVDFSMPGMDGFGFASAARAEAELAGARLVLLSSMVDRVSPEQIRAAGFAGYLIKPVRDSRLFECLAAVLDSERSAPPGKERRRRLIDWEALCQSSFRRRMSVLLAEDNPVNRRVAVLMLEKLGCAVDVAEDGEEAVRATGARSYDLVLMDCHMPRLDGFEATRAIRRRELSTRQHVPIVALTAHAMPGDRDLCFAAGMDDYLSKPIKIVELATALRQLRRAEAG